jgi:hypothetical protein
MQIVLAQEQAEVLAQMAADLDLDPSLLVEHLLSDRLAQYGNLSLWEM